MGFLGEERKASISRELSKIYQENIKEFLNYSNSIYNLKEIKY